MYRRLNLGVEPPSETQIEHSESFRVLHNVEKLAIAPGAFGYLIQLRELNIISAEELELIIERSMLSGFEELDVSAMQSIVESVLFETDGQERGQDRFFAQSNDTIH